MRKPDPNWEQMFEYYKKQAHERELIQKFGLNRAVLYRRRKLGWSYKKIMTKPLDRRFYPKARQWEQLYDKNISQSGFRYRRTARGLTRNQAMRLPVDNTTKHFIGSTHSARELCDLFGNTLSRYYDRVNYLGWDRISAVVMPKGSKKPAQPMTQAQLYGRIKSRRREIKRGGRPPRKFPWQ